MKAVMPSLKVFHILDLDRTLLNTSKLAHSLKQIVVQDDQELAGAIDAEIKEHFDNKTSFFIFEYIASKVGDLKFHTYIGELHKTLPKEALFLPGALERIAFAKSQPGWALGIMTYGSRRDQMIKLKLLGLHHEHLLITNTAEKGEIIATWLQPDGRFKLPIEFGGHIVDTVTLDDDKRVAFKGLPKGAYGQWISSAALGGTTDLQYFNENIRIVANLEGSVGYLKTKL